MTDYKKLYEQYINSIRSGVKVNTSLNRLTRSTKISENAKVLLKISIIQSLYLGMSSGYIARELGVSGEEANKYDMLAKAINEYADSDKFNLLIHILETNEIKNVKKGRRILFYFKHFNINDIDKKYMNKIMNESGAEAKKLLFSAPTTVELTCINCGKKALLTEFAQGENTCKKCVNLRKKNSKNNGGEEDVAKLSEDTETGETSETSQTTVDIDQRHELIERIDSVKSFFSDTSSKLFEMIDTDAEKVVDILNLIDTFSILIKKETN